MKTFLVRKSDTGRVYVMRVADRAKVGDVDRTWLQKTELAHVVGLKFLFELDVSGSTVTLADTYSAVSVSVCDRFCL
jgi:hypothetical protein